MPASHATRATILSGKRDYFTPAAQGEAESRIGFPNPSPCVRAWIRLQSCPYAHWSRSSMGSLTTLTATKQTGGLSKTQPWFPMAEAGSVQRFDPPPSPLKIKAVH